MAFFRNFFFGENDTKKTELNFQKMELSGRRLTFRDFLPKKSIKNGEKINSNMTRNIKSEKK